MPLHKGLPVGTVLRCVRPDHMHFVGVNWVQVPVGTVGLIAKVWDGGLDINVPVFGLGKDFSWADPRWEVVDEEQ